MLLEKLQQVKHKMREGEDDITINVAKRLLLVTLVFLQNSTLLSKG